MTKADILDGRTITVVASSEPNLGHTRDIIERTLIDTGSIVSGVFTKDLSPATLGDIVIVRDSLQGGSILGVDAVAAFVREKVGRQIPLVVIKFSLRGPTLANTSEGVIALNKYGEVPEALRELLRAK